jgi:hypothetical protein
MSKAAVTASVASVLMYTDGLAKLKIGVRAIVTVPLPFPSAVLSASSGGFGQIAVTRSWTRL